MSAPAVHTGTALVREIMASEVVTVGASESVNELVRVLEERRITGVPVVDADDALVGVVSHRDVIGLAVEMERIPEAMRWGLGLGESSHEKVYLQAPEAGEFFAYYVTPSGGFIDVRDKIRDLPTAMFNGYRVEDVMTPVPVTIDPDATVRELAKLLRAEKVHRVLVVDHGKLVGIASATDVLEAVASGAV